MYQQMKRITSVFACSAAATVVLFCLNVFFGSVDIPAAGVCDVLLGRSSNEAWRFIVLESRLVQAVTAMLGGAALSAAGLMLQTCFANPLADTSILGVNAGASLGAALAIMLLGGGLASATLPVSGFVLVLVAAFVGSAAVLAMLSAFAAVLRSNLLLLISGIMVSYVTSAFISLLSSFATVEGVHLYVFWGMGNFGGVSSGMLPLFAAVITAGLVGSALMIKPLNIMLLGDGYARNLGVPVRSARLKILVITGVLGATVTAFCGPVAFIGLAVPHVARFLSGTVNHKVIMPLAMVCGAAVALACNFVCNLPAGNGIFIPLNAVMSLWGVPVILYVLFVGYRQKTLN